MRQWVSLFVAVLKGRGHGWAGTPMVWVSQQQLKNVSKCVTILVPRSLILQTWTTQVSSYWEGKRLNKLLGGYKFYASQSWPPSPSFLSTTALAFFWELSRRNRHCAVTVFRGKPVAKEQLPVLLVPWHSQSSLLLLLGLSLFCFGVLFIAFCFVLRQELTVALAGLEFPM